MATDCLNKITVQLREPIEDGERWIASINIPCGKCARCIERRKMEWSFRMNEELKQSKTAYFVTLTYSPETVPYGKYGHKTLHPPDLTKYFKRVRTNTKRDNKKGKIAMEHLANNLKPGDKIKYYACGEYGEQRGRPHYHAIVFNATRSVLERSWVITNKKEKTTAPIGAVHILKANEASINYTMKYLDKRKGDQVKDWRRLPEYNTMSEGIGLAWLEKNKDWHSRNIDILYVMNEKGIKVPMPRYYREQIFTDQQRKEQVKIVTNQLQEQREEELLDLGHEEYNKIQAMKRQVSELRFEKKIKKRIID